MLTVKAIKKDAAGGAKKATDYLLQDQGRPNDKNYYQESQSAPSEWQGRGAEMLGLSGAVDTAVFRELLENGPDGMKTAADRRLGVDLTWSVPKSVSMLIESAPPEMQGRLIELCREANAVGMQHIEDHVVSARYGKGGAISEKTGVAIIASFHHNDARPVDVGDGEKRVDMDTHFHNAVINATFDGTGWRSLDLDFGALAVEQHLADIKAKAFLAKGLEKMGIATERTRDGFEIAGISRDQILEFSQRSHEIEAELRERGLSRETSSAAERNAANLETRKSKSRKQTHDDLRYEWRQRLREAGVEFSQFYDPACEQELIAERERAQEVFPGSNTITEKEQYHEQRIEQYSSQEPHAFDIGLRDGLGLRQLSECRLDADEKRQVAGFLPPHVGPGRSEDHTLRRKPAVQTGEHGGLGNGVTKWDHTRQAIDAALDHLSEKESLFDRRQLMLEAIKQGMGQVQASDIDAVMQVHGRIVWAGEQSKTVENTRGKKIVVRAEMVTTVESVARDGWIQGFCSEGRGKLSPLMSCKDAEQAVAAAEERQGFSFAEDQKAAVMATLTSEDRVSALIGGAGTGKTTAMRSVVDAARSMGLETVGLTPSHGARQELQDAGTDQNITTAAFLMQKAQEDQRPRLYILDEAGMVGSQTMQAVLQRLGPQDRILLSGDPDQMKPVEAGDPLQMLADADAIQISRLSQVQRQAKANDRDLLALGQAWANRDTEKALDLVQKYIHEARPTVGTGPADKDGTPKITTQDRRKAIAAATVAEYLGRSVEDRARTMIVCPTNEVRAMVNTGIREALQASGVLSADQVVVTQLVKTDLTATHMRQAQQYEVGQILRTKEGRGQGARAVDYEILKIDGRHNQLTLKRHGCAPFVMDAAAIDPRKYQCFTPRKGMGLSIGDPVVIRDNSINEVQNGDGGRIVDVTDSHEIVLTMDRGGRRIVLDDRQRQAIDFGYARTVNDSQGKSVDLTIMTGEASSGSSRNLLLVGTTRMKYGLSVITDDKNALIQRSEAFADKNAAAQARKRADCETDRRLDRLDSILERGRAQGVQDVEKQLQQAPEKVPEQEEKCEEMQHEQRHERRRELEIAR